ncbi:PAS domain-containing protein [Helicobacter turcicus]|uniref:PAS domain-containing protein n=1 Tax=Helicobacter turcicus TaxID=2867412 RepID=A0ABS7JQ07_9HELI|nr:PAS domain-containing protein [Helicobacter turcicus]MBX7491481.1 PAS domain-containing protein [Helicobacter turcicus]MBX7546338.1 PAS domain-containing protein [Helicobacter turcicus]
MKKAIPNSNERNFEEDEIIVSKTDLKGRILYGNRIFIELSGYTEKELLGKPHNIVRHPDMPKVVFKILWDGMSNAKEIVAYVKNLSKDGSFYWVKAYVTPSFNGKGEVVGYHSIRLKPTEQAKSAAAELYKELLEIEKRDGIQKSQERLEEILTQKGMSYEEFILSL